MREKPKHAGKFGSLVGLIPIDNNNNKNNKKTKTMKITEHLYERFIDHSRTYYNVESYDTILENLLDYYEKNNPKEFRYSQIITNTNNNNNNNKD